MFKCCAEQCELVTIEFYLLGKQYLCISKQELEVMQNAVAVLEPFQEPTTDMSAEMVASLSKAIPTA